MYYPFTAFGCRITPAHAGKSIIVISNLPSGKDHPRTCGEKQAIDLMTFIANGSPPHMRGKDYYGTKDQWVNGITPAHAGKR